MSKKRVRGKDLVVAGVAGALVGGVTGSKGLQSLGGVAFTLGVVDMALNSKNKKKYRRR